MNKNHGEYNDILEIPLSLQISVKLPRKIKYCNGKKHHPYFSSFKVDTSTYKYFRNNLTHNLHGWAEKNQSFDKWHYEGRMHRLDGPSFFIKK